MKPLLLTVVGQRAFILQDPALVYEPLFVHRDPHRRRDVLLKLLHCQLEGMQAV